MLPKILCIIDDDREYTEFLAQFLRQQGIVVANFRDSDDFLMSNASFDFDFYLVDLMLPGVDGVDLIRLLRRRGDAGIVAVSGRLGSEVLDSVLTAGADMYLAKPLRFEQILLAVLACFVDAQGAPVTRATLCERLGREQTTESDNWLHATIYRLRRRLEQATEELVPLQSQPRVGYVFHGKLTAV